MNIFHLDNQPELAAQMLCDKHVVSQLKESAQILSTVSWRYGVRAPYQAAWKSHPVVRWAGDTLGNWRWTVQHGLAICQEYTDRYGRIHKSEQVIRWADKKGGKPTKGDFTPPPLCMPEHYRQDDYVQAYRAYYLGAKAKFAKWKEPASVPEWWDAE